MRRALRSGLAGASLVLVAVWLAAPAQIAQAQDPPHHGQQAGEASGPHAKQGPRQGMHEKMQGMHEKMKSQMMDEMAKSKPMMLRHQMLMTMQVAPDDPAALLAVKDKLDLTEKQVKELHKILEQARKKASEILTKEQKAELTPVAKTPDTSQKMHQEMMAKMQKMHQGMDGTKAPGQVSAESQCPMMQMMQKQERQKAGPSTAETPQKTKIK